MGDIFSTPSNSTTNPTETQNPSMSSSETPEAPSESTLTPAQEPSDPPPTHTNKETLTPAQETSDPPPTQTNKETQQDEGEKITSKGEDEEEEEEEEGECGFCLFMKGGGCKDSFVEWEKCIEEGEKNKEDIVDKCFEVTTALKKCMEAHPDYYEPILRAEKAAEAEAVKELEKEKENEKEAAQSSSENLDTKKGSD